MSLLEKIKKSIGTHLLFDHSDNLLIAVSGGIDSMVLLHLLNELNYTISVAHCNFNLRANESDLDQEFVENYCRDHGIHFMTKSFDTERFCKEQKLSIQEGARELRYAWFDELLTDESFDKCCTAHHSDDNIETFLINLLRGTGIKGLRGIPIKNKNIVRPLLEVSRKDIEQYAFEHEIPFKEDQSNKDTKYLRNKIRLELLPLLSELNPQFKEALLENIKYNKDLWNILAAQLRKIESRFVKISNGDYKIDLNGLFTIENYDFFLFHILQQFHFTTGEIKEIQKITTSQSGKKVVGSQCTALKDRDLLLISGHQNFSNLYLNIERGTSKVDQGLVLELSELDAEDIELRSDNRCGLFDFEKITFPIHIRTWKDGDRFIPLGMNKQKKLSDFFIDAKLDLFQKDKVPLMISGNEIAWVLGHRISDKFKVDSTTKKVLKIDWLDE